MLNNPNELDLAAKRRDGGVELIIMSDSPLDDSAETQTQLLDKVENYMKYALSPQFRQDFGNVPANQVWIILNLPEPPSRLISALCQKIQAWVKGSNLNFTVRVRKQ